MKPYKETASERGYRLSQNKPTKEQHSHAGKLSAKKRKEKKEKK